MNKRIIVGSVLVLTLLLLIPSIPAIQHKVVKDEALSEIPNDLKDFEEIKDLFTSRILDRMKHPVLFVVVYIIILIQYSRAVCHFLAVFLFGFLYSPPNFMYIIPMLRIVIKMIVTILLVEFWTFVSETLGWNWPVEYFEEPLKDID